MPAKSAAYYDDPAYNYKKYWLGREYEDLSERSALQKLFALVPSKKSLLDIGGGFGRLVPEYAGLFGKCLLIDPSKKLLSEAKKLCSFYKNLSVKQGSIENLPTTDKECFDVVISVRTLHHLHNLPLAIKQIARLVKPGGYVIIEFANKIRFKNIAKALFSFNLDFLTNHIPIDLSKEKGIVPFVSYHPNQIKTLLLANGFTITKTLSVSNFRHVFFKKLIPLPLLLKAESFCSGIFSSSSLLRFFGPSVFILAKKK